MPEIDNVQIGETIAVEWGNAIRDRTIQRYANATERAQLHPNPTEGDLSYLEDTNSIEVYDGFTWIAGIPTGAVTTAKIADGAVTAGKIANGAVSASKIAGNAIAAFERSGATVATSVNVPSATGTFATVTLNIPSDWSSWNCVAFAHATARPLDNPGEINLLVQIDGTDGTGFRYQVPGPSGVAVTAASFRSGITTTGNRTIRLQGFRFGSAAVELATVFLYARAFRTS